MGSINNNSNNNPITNTINSDYNYKLETRTMTMTRKKSIKRVLEEYKKSNGGKPLTNISIDDDIIDVEDYSIKNGLSFIKFYNLHKLTIDVRTINGNKDSIVYITKGDVLRSPDMYTGEDIEIVMFKSAITVLKKQKARAGYFIVNKTGRRKYFWINVPEVVFMKLIKYSNKDVLREEQELRE